jgi:uncharacterized protein
MPKEFTAQRLDVRAFAEAGGALSARTPLAAFGRLLAEAQGRGAERDLHWSARGEHRNPHQVRPQAWLHLQAQAVLSLTCQRCLAPVDVTVAVDRSFRFVDDEATAEAEDDAAEEDLLALSRDFDLPALVEDEILLALPLVPRHDACPQPLPAAMADPGADADGQATRPNPFAVLQQLKAGGGVSGAE